MSTNEDWDVEKHKSEHECDEHWELRRKFLVAHKDKYGEDELVCLAQVFTNIELLGCRYPKETMDLIAELSQDIAAEYREKKNKKLQRTFVKASDAASSKVKGYTDQAYDAPGPSSHRELPLKRPSTDEEETEEAPFKKIKVKYKSFPYGDIVLVERPDDVPQTILASSIAVSGGNLEWKYNKEPNMCTCIININSIQMAMATGTSQRIAKKEAAILTLDELRKYYYTIKFKQNMDALETNLIVQSTGSTNAVESSSYDNIGKKLMKLMGWSGGGLGKSQQGILEPVIPKHQLSREGLGLKENSVNIIDLKMKCRDIFDDFITGNVHHDIVFSMDFTKDERAIIHKVARQMGLKSRSYGPADQRKLVISRKISIRSLVEELKSIGGSNDRYELVEPTEKDFVSPSSS